MNANNPLHTITSVIDCFSDIEDPRVEGRIAHKLIDILVLTICAAICGAPRLAVSGAYRFIGAISSCKFHTKLDART